MWIIRLLVVLVLIIGGFSIVRKPDWALDLVGELPFFEKYFSGGTRFFLQLFGTFLILVAFAIITGVDQDVLNFVAGILVPYRR